MIKQQFIYNDKIYDLIFDEITYKLYKEFIGFCIEDIIIHNGYLAKQSGDISKIEYFHRFIFNVHFKLGGKEIHHINKNKRDNRLVNLKILTKKEHLEFHKMFKMSLLNS